mmetsp:Transcript_36682/g.93755  ORF Transcript_36682/g.93755 Transcript_36682/m.93755 type:complete len:220 (-) Transcript_36682:126-785(-)
MARSSAWLGDTMARWRRQPAARAALATLTGSNHTGTPAEDAISATAPMVASSRLASTTTSAAAAMSLVKLRIHARCASASPGASSAATSATAAPTSPVSSKTTATQGVLSAECRMPLSGIPSDRRWFLRKCPAGSSPTALMSSGGGAFPPVSAATHSAMLRPTPPAACRMVPGTVVPAARGRPGAGTPCTSSTMPPITTTGPVASARSVRPLPPCGASP